MGREPVKLALLGDPVAHSLSPRIMAALGRLTGRAVVYRACRVPSQRLAFAVGLLRSAGFRGSNVTVPHKSAVIPFLDSLTAEARRIGAVNAVRCVDGRMLGHNTDRAGFADALCEAGFSPRGRDAVIFGAGGAARAVAAALGRLKARRVTIAARRPAAAQALAREFAASFPATAFRSGPPPACDLAVNATPLGLPGLPDRSPAPSGWGGCGLAFDLVYGRRTAFQAQALAQGARALGGTGMLVFQALRAWEFWFGPFPAGRRETLKNAVLEALRCA